MHTTPDEILAELHHTFPDKFAPEQEIFKRISRGNRLFISTGCGEPQYLIGALFRYVESDPNAFADAEIFQVGTPGGGTYTDERFTFNFRYNSFFVSDKSRDSVNRGLADYTPVFLSRLPDLFARKQLSFNVALIQTSLPDKNGYVSLGISVDVCKAAIENADCVIAQLNASMPRVHGDSFVNVRDLTYLVRHDEPLLEYNPGSPCETTRQVGRYVSKIVGDGDTIQIGYGHLPNAILESLEDKKHLGIHTEFLTDAVVDMIKRGVIDNSKKTVDRGRTVASFCMGTAGTYRYIDDNPEMEFRTIDYTNDPRVISRLQNMTAINSALQIDLTGQATVESVDGKFYSGIGGSADFMRGALLAPGGKTILAIESTARGGEVSRIVPFLKSGTGVTFNRGDIFYVVTEFGIAYLHGKNIRERAMDLIAIAHPKFREWLIEEARQLSIIYKDQAFISGKNAEYPEYLEQIRTLKNGRRLLFRPVRMNDEGIVKDFFYSLSDQSLYRRFISPSHVLPHQMRQNIVVIDYSKELVVLAIESSEHNDHVVGIGQFSKDASGTFAEIAVAVKDAFHNTGIGTQLLQYLTEAAGNEGLQGFTADVLTENAAMLRVFEKMRFTMKKELVEGVYRLTMRFQPAARPVPQVP